jgi:hypothetical protein
VSVSVLTASPEGVLACVAADQGGGQAKEEHLRIPSGLRCYRKYPWRVAGPEPGRCRAALRQRRQRHVPYSIASLRHCLGVLLARQLDLCPCCERRRAYKVGQAVFMTQ